ncbi:MAG: serine/threonine-protein kinase [Actinomycetota bacterium]|nr:serine/threonine-protein kinase [Actinomycetota bacterium]
MRRVGDYELVEILGEANHGTFYRARPPAGGGASTVVLKVLHGHASAYDVRRVTNELKLLSSLDSPHIAEVLDAGYADGSVYYAMVDYPDGTLAAPNRPLSATDRAHLVADAALGAHQLHELGVAHRDIRPANIAIDGRRGRLVDLGLAQVTADTQPSMHGIVGVPVYMAPELITRGDAGRASDVWALGVTLHEALTGRLPVVDRPVSSAESTLRHLHESPPQLDPAVDPGFAAIIATCLARTPKDRYLTAESLAVALHAAADRAEP